MVSHFLSRKDSSLSHAYASCQQEKQVQLLNIESRELNPTILPVLGLLFIWHRAKSTLTSYIFIKDMLVFS